MKDTRGQTHMGDHGEMTIAVIVMILSMVVMDIAGFRMANPVMMAGPAFVGLATFWVLITRVNGGD